MKGLCLILTLQAITNISIGSVCGRLRCQRQLDSYTEEDLNVLRERWSEALKRRRMYLDQQVRIRRQCYIVLSKNPTSRVIRLGRKQKMGLCTGLIRKL